MPPGTNPAATEKEPLPPGAEPSGGVRYGAWTIYYDPPPIPIRTMDWHFVHDNFDASYEGEEDGWVSNGLAGHAASLDACKAEIDEMEADRAAS